MTGALTYEFHLIYRARRKLAHSDPSRVLQSRYQVISSLQRANIIEFLPVPKLLPRSVLRSLATACRQLREQLIPSDL